MANEHHIQFLRQGSSVWNEWRRNMPDVQPDLSEADLYGGLFGGVNLPGANLREVNFRGANLREANLREVDLGLAGLRRADLSGADLTGARLRGANLAEANLKEANLKEADLTGADLSQADLSQADLSLADFRGADLSDANLSGADLTGARCVNTRLTGATLTGCTVYGISAWDIDLDDTVQKDLRITPAREKSAITVDNLEVAQFLYLLLHNHKVRDILDTITSKVVLILGRFGDRMPILDTLREALRHHPYGYIPVLFDFEPQREKPILETVKTLANLARFVIADLTDPNMVRSEVTYIVANVPTVPVQPVIEAHANLPTEYTTWKTYASFLPIYRYDDVSKLVSSLSESVIAPAEQRVQSRRAGHLEDD